VTGFVSRIEDARRREFRRLLGYSGVAHLLLLLAFTFSPRPGGTALPAVVRVDLVAAAPARARPAAAKPKPRPRKTVLPAQPTRAPKPAPKPEPKPEPVAKPEPAAEPQVDYDDFLEKLREEAGEAEEPVEMASAASARPGTGRGVPVTPEVMAWMRSAKVHVTRAWVLAPGFRTQPLSAWYDESVERAIKKASPLPPPPEADEWLFVFRPEDVL
jgi:hypothetical protein